MYDYQRTVDKARLWQSIQGEAFEVMQQMPLLAGFYQRHILERRSFNDALCSVLAEKLKDEHSGAEKWHDFLSEQMLRSGDIAQSAMQDLLCQLESNASIKDHSTPLLYFGGYQALQCYRIAHYCWHNNMQPMALYIQAKVASVFGIDIHPAAKIGSGIFLDHAVGIVIGETAVVEDDVTIFQSVTLGGTGKGQGDRHPKIRKGAFIGAGAVIFGNIEVGENAKVAGGAVVVKPVEPNTTVASSFSTPIGHPRNQ
ncbi:serine acetyltransferase [Vibrio sp. vnigr-6D03]|uniref:Serine acetyltransferase n=1 Tax=Vibrio penaeicida TaxID=104609 RepID=A0AAV5NXP7_9VIBR|nr:MULTISPECIES: serine O-acetyltransferase EpsC [Vibrio]PKF78949.1 serine acetyltransferase [Vibrio sp. vnigr-6D03]RTZ23304.1 serine acetyltransferase [Vibrio penaeicida]GLQ75340.1 serine O-acetyltransferase [Vibrio penaeicida]